MSSLANNQQTWAPYETIKDCSQGFCSIYCPQWCYIIFPPPPPFEFPDDDSGTNFSPLVIAIIGILASAFLLVSYYTVISKYCGNLDSLRRSTNQNEEPNEDQNPNLEPWQVSTLGLDETLIKSITVCKYKKGDGFVESTDCSVCLSEFEDNENLRLLPKCSHAFHLTCIDTWLKSHSNCPLCRANIVSTSPLLVQSPPPVTEIPTDIGSSLENHHENHTMVFMVEEIESHHRSNIIPKTPLRGFASSEKRETVIEVRDGRIQPIRRSVSMDNTSLGHVSIADILCISEDDDPQTRDYSFKPRRSGEHSKFSSSRSQMLHCVKSPMAMKRSFSSGRFLFTRNIGRGKHLVIPL